MQVRLQCSSAGCGRGKGRLQKVLLSWGTACSMHGVVLQASSTRMWCAAKLTVQPYRYPHTQHPNVQATKPNTYMFDR